MALPSTTIVPFASLPSCALECGPLYDANGACVPPAVPANDASVYNTCFCNNAALQGLGQGTSGVCENQCNEQGLSGIRDWFTSFCAQNAAAPTTTGTSSTSSATSSGSIPAGQQGGGGTWFETHVRWVVMIIIVFVGITGIWVGACIWRRKYLKKKDRMYELGKGLPSSIAVNTQGNLVGPGVSRNSKYANSPGMFMSGPSAEKTRK
ncbi:hypothetical protein DL769_009706 [Monosporascus sp. CRB-8-3]|nr:hypothetical protein DL769_009706 [Monosporascus sp. CRB-8-3]